MGKRRMNGNHRKDAIVGVALPLFAKHGFACTTTKQLARAAGVSEALLYRHFPSKESLYQEIKNVHCQGADPALQQLLELKPSTTTLIYVIYYLMSAFANVDRRCGMDWETRYRLVLHSCLEDGSYLRFLFENQYQKALATIEKSLDAAWRDGDLVASPASKTNRLLFSHHLAVMLGSMHLPGEPIFNYKATRNDLIHQATWYALRGLGLKDEAINRHFDPQATALLTGNLSKPTPTDSETKTKKSVRKKVSK